MADTPIGCHQDVKVCVFGSVQERTVAEVPHPFACAVLRVCPGNARIPASVQRSLARMQVSARRNLSGQASNNAARENV